MAVSLRDKAHFWGAAGVFKMFPLHLPHRTVGAAEGNTLLRPDIGYEPCALLNILFFFFSSCWLKQVSRGEKDEKICL